MALGVPLAVLGNAMGPYDDPKAWALPILVALTGLAWLAARRQAVDPADETSDARARVLRWLLLACLAWSAITTANSSCARRVRVSNRPSSIVECTSHTR